MNPLRALFLTWILASAAPSAGPAATVEPGPGTSGPDLWLRGPFGRVEGVAPGAVEAPGVEALDAWVRDAPLVLDAGPATAWVAGFVVTAVPLGAAERESWTLSVDELAFTGPSEAGRFVVVAEVDGLDGSVSRQAWLLEVPDRPAPADGILDIPAPAVVVQNATGSARGWMGDGCYIDLCVDVGQMPPAAQLPSLRTAVGETLGARISDGSPIVAWKGSLRAVGSPLAARAASGVLTDVTETTVPLHGLETTSPGAWVLTLEVELDRERGWLQTHHRIVANE